VNMQPQTSITESPIVWVKILILSSTVVPSSNTIRQFRFYNPATALSQYAYSGLRCFQITKTLTTTVEAQAVPF